MASLARFAQRIDGRLGEFIEITLRIGQPIEMIAAQPADPPFFDVLQDFLMDGLEDGRLFDADGGERIDVKETAVIDLVGGHTPITEPIWLGFEQCFEPVKAAGNPRGPVEAFERLRDRKFDGSLVIKLGPTLLDVFAEFCALTDRKLVAEQCGGERADAL